MTPSGTYCGSQMAISFSRPDPSSPAAVGSAAFPTSRRGFDQGEVRDFLRMVAAEMARLQERERFLESEMRALQTRGMSAPGRLDEETVTSLLGEEAARVLTAARDASTQIRDRAEESATRLVKDAAEDAARIRESAMIEAARIREDAAHDAEQEIEMAKQQGRDMVNEAREYREKVLSELSRRRDAARAQIEQLLHGRDRLLNAFERARLASEDVINGLTDAHDEPEFIVDLAPTTGPVPIVNPAHPSVTAYDQDNESVQTEVAPEVIVDAPVVSVYDFNEEDLVVEDSHVEETIADVIEEAVTTINEEALSVVTDLDESPVVSDHPVHMPTDDTDVVVDIAPVVDEAQSAVDAVDLPATDEAQTNVVSLFGRGRKNVDLPEIQEEAVVDVVDVADVVVEVPGEVVAPAPTAKKGADDIFAKLRASAPAEVAAKAVVTPPTGEVETPAAKKPTKKFEAPRTAVVAADPAMFSARDESLAPLIGVIARKLKRVLADEQNTVLEHLRAKKSSLEIDAILGAPDVHAQRYSAAIVDETMAAASDGAKAVKHAGGSSRRVTQKAIATHVADTILNGLVAAFREDTRIAIGEAEGDRDILSSLMRDVYRMWKMESLETHVDDIACSAYSKGGFLSLEPGCKVSWMVDPVAKCCSECEDNALGGVVVRGEEFPTGHQHPPAHPGCRCLVGPNHD